MKMGTGLCPVITAFTPYPRTTGCQFFWTMSPSVEITHTCILRNSFINLQRHRSEMKICIPLKQLWGSCGESRPWGQAGRQVNRLMESVKTGRVSVIGQQCVSFPLRCVSGDQKPPGRPGGRASFCPWVGGTSGFLGFCPGVSCPWVCGGEGRHSQLCFFILFLVVRFVFVLFSVFPPSCFPGSPGGAADPEWRQRLQRTLRGEHRQPGRPGRWRVPRSVSWLLSPYLALLRALQDLPAQGKARPCTRGRIYPWDHIFYVDTGLSPDSDGVLLLWNPCPSAQRIRGFCGGQVWTSFFSPQTLLVSEPLMLHDALRARWAGWRCMFWEGWRCVCTTSSSVWPKVLFWSVQYFLPSPYVSGSDTRTGGGRVTGGEGWGGMWKTGLRQASRLFWNHNSTGHRGLHSDIGDLCLRLGGWCPSPSTSHLQTHDFC